MLKSILTNSTFTMISRVLGFIRDVLMAHILGAGLVSDCFFVAFKLPNFFRRLFAEGAFNAAFVPMFSKTLESGASQQLAMVKAKDFAEQVLAVLLVTLLLVFGVFEIFMPYVMYVLAPGFSDEPERYNLAVDLTRTTFCYLLFISLVSLYSGILNTLMKFAVTAAAPILLNVALITALVGFSAVTKTPGHALAWGVAAAGVLQLVWVAGAAGRSGMALRLRLPKFSKDVMDFVKLIAPAALGAGAMQLNLMMDNVLASFLPKGSISYLYYADRINEFPIGVIGVAVGTVLLPFLSRQLAAGNEKDALNSLNRAMELVLLLTLPAAAACLVVATPLIQVLFQSGQFTAADTAPTVYTLMAFSLGLPAYVLVKILTPGYYARHDTRTPVRFAMICIGVNFCLNVILMLSLMPFGSGPCRPRAVDGDRGLGECRAAEHHPSPARAFQCRCHAQAADSRCRRRVARDGDRTGRNRFAARLLFPRQRPRTGGRAAGPAGDGDRGLFRHRPFPRRLPDRRSEASFAARSDQAKRERRLTKPVREAITPRAS